MNEKIVCRLEKLDHLIGSNLTGTPDELSQKLQISRRSVFEYLTLLNELGAVIHYDKAAKTYYYKKKGSFRFRFIREHEMHSV